MIPNKVQAIPSIKMSPIAGQDVLDKLGHMVEAVKADYKVNYAAWDEATREERTAKREAYEKARSEAYDEWVAKRQAAIEKHRYGPFHLKRSDEEAFHAAYKAFESDIFRMPDRVGFYEQEGPRLPRWYQEADELLTAARTFPSATFEVRTGLITAIENGYEGLAP